MAWHKQLLVPRPSAVETACTVCGRAMWLPASKLAEYRRCSKECIRLHRNAAKETRRRNCETCGSPFIPRQVQLNNGGGRFCSQKCNPSDHLISADALAKAQQIRRQRLAAGITKLPSGPENKQWMGGRKACYARRIASGKAAASTRAYRAKNPHKLREWKRRRSNGKVLPRLPWGTIPRLGEAQRWRCAICRCSIKIAYHVDHIRPIARGGKHEPRNLQLLCATCNVRKSAKDPITYMQELGRLL